MSSEHGQALPAGYELDGYHIEAVLGAGGFGITYRAREIEIKRAVAIKEFLPAGIAMRGSDGASIRPISAGEEEFYEYGLERFRGEAETLVRFDHPNIVRVYRYFQANGTGYLVMQYVEGDSLDAILDRAGTLTEAEIHEVLDPILAGLQQVHAAGFLHRDIKPANIYIRADGSPILLDFGAARLALGEKSKSLTAIVSGGYAPFEQYSSKVKQGPWTDIYALGATLYRAVTGRAPPDAMDRIEEDEIVPARDAAGNAYSAALLEAIDAALVMKGAERPQSISAFRALLATAPAAASADGGEAAAAAGHTLMPQGAQESVAAPPEPAPAAPPPTKRSGTGARWVIAALVAVILAGGGYFGWDAYQASERRESEAAAAKRAAERARQAAAAAEARRKAEAEAKRKAAEAKRRITTRPLLLWEKTLGSKAGTWLALSLTRMPNGDFVVAGHVRKEAKTRTANLRVLRIDEGGRVIWDRTLDRIESSADSISFTAVKAGGVVGVATGKPKNKGDSDVTVFRLAGDGKLLWRRSFGGGKNDNASAVIALPDGGFAVAAGTESKGSGDKDAWILRLDSNGRLLWDRTFGGAKYENAAALVVLPDGGFAVAGTTASKGAGAFDLWLLRLDSAGKLLWDRTFGGKGYDYAGQMIVRPDGSFVISAVTGSKGAGKSDVWVLHLDAQGKLKRDQTFGGALSDQPLFLRRLPNDDVLLVSLDSTKSKKYRSTLRRLDRIGQVRWDWTIGGPENHVITSVVAMPDGEFVVVGVTGDKGFKTPQSWIRRLGYPATAEARRKVEEEARRRAAEARRKAAEEARRKAAEAARRKAAEEARRKAAAAARRKAAQEARRKAAEAARRRAAEQARRRDQADRRHCGQRDTDAASFAACNRLISGGRLKGRPLAYIYVLRGVKYGRRKEYQRALADFNRSIALAPNAGLGYYYRGLAYSQLGNTRLAINNFNRAIFLTPKNFRAYYNRGAMHMRLGDRSSAIRDFRTALRLNPKYTLARTALTRLGVSP